VSEVSHSTHTKSSRVGQTRHPLADIQEKRQSSPSPAVYFYFYYHHQRHFRLLQRLIANSIKRQLVDPDLYAEKPIHPFHGAFCFAGSSRQLPLSYCVSGYSLRVHGACLVNAVLFIGPMS
jgi:hypothetical protein